MQAKDFLGHSDDHFHFFYIQWDTKNSESLILSFLEVLECETYKNDKISDSEFHVSHCRIKEISETFFLFWWIFFC